MAPLVVPFALIRTGRWENQLPRWAQWWDNDVSINGDIPEYWDFDYKGDCYYAPGHHPRSFWARYVWLGWRNRASRLAQVLGHTWTDKTIVAKSWGDELVSKEHEGWCLNEKQGVYQLYIVKKLTSRFCYRFNWGHKIWTGTGDGRDVANVVTLSFSVLGWKGK